MQVATNQQAQPQAAQIQIVSADRIRFSCEECGLAFANQSDLKTHKSVQHQQTQTHPKGKNCESCGAQLPQDNKKKNSVVSFLLDLCINGRPIHTVQNYKIKQNRRRQLHITQKIALQC